MMLNADVHLDGKKYRVFVTQLPADLKLGGYGLNRSERWAWLSDLPARCFPIGYRKTATPYGAMFVVGPFKTESKAVADAKEFLASVPKEPIKLDFKRLLSTPGDAGIMLLDWSGIG